MITSFVNRLFRNTIYVQISKNRIIARWVEKGKEISDSPLVGLDGKNRVVAVGEDAKIAACQGMPGYHVLNGFDHPRTIIGHFEIAETFLRYVFALLVKSRIFVRPIVVMHPTESYQGGLSQIEIRALRELGFSAGARIVHVWTGRELSDFELVQLSFPAGAGELL
jgi:rod shape-determining protein MreB